MWEVWAWASGYLLYVFFQNYLIKVYSLKTGRRKLRKEKIACSFSIDEWLLLAFYILMHFLAILLFFEYPYSWLWLYIMILNRVTSETFTCSIWEIKITKYLFLDGLLVFTIEKNDIRHLYTSDLNKIIP